MNRSFFFIIPIIISCNSRNHAVEKKSIARKILSQGMLSLECRNFKEVSFENLKDRPKAYDKMKVRITGYFFSGFEDFAIYKTEKREKENGLWIEFDEK